MPPPAESESIAGQLTHAGSFIINSTAGNSGEEVTGVFISIPRDRLREIRHLPMYREVRVGESAPVLRSILDETSEALCHLDATHPAFPAIRRAREIARSELAKR